MNTTPPILCQKMKNYVIIWRLTLVRSTLVWDHIGVRSTLFWDHIGVRSKSMWDQHWREINIAMVAAADWLARLRNSPINDHRTDSGHWWGEEPLVGRFTELIQSGCVGSSPVIVSPSLSYWPAPVIRVAGSQQNAHWGGSEHNKGLESESVRILIAQKSSGTRDQERGRGRNDNDGFPLELRWRAHTLDNGG